MTLHPLLFLRSGSDSGPHALSSKADHTFSRAAEGQANDCYNNLWCRRVPSCILFRPRIRGQLHWKAGRRTKVR